MACENERKKFAMCRATKVGRSKDPSFCESQTADYMQCHHEMTLYVRKNCESQYLNAYDCLKTADSVGSFQQRMQ